MSFFTSFLERLQNSGREKEEAMFWMIRLLNGKKEETITEKDIESKHDTFLKKKLKWNCFSCFKQKSAIVPEDSLSTMGNSYNFTGIW